MGCSTADPADEHGDAELPVGSGGAAVLPGAGLWRDEGGIVGRDLVS